MQGSGSRLGAMLVAAALLAGCMSGRSSLLATQGAGASRAGGATPATLAGYPIGSSGNLGALGAASARRSGPASNQVSVGLVAPAPSVGGLRVSSGLAAAAGPVAATAGAGVSINPTLAPASSVGASVAAVSQPLNLAASAQVRAKTGSAQVLKSTVKIKAAGLGATVHVGG